MKKLALLSCLLLGVWAKSNATVTWSVVTQPCNNNGTLQATSNIPGSLTYNFYTASSWIPITNTTGILTNWGGGPVNVSVNSNLPQTYDYGTFAGSPPFTYTKTVTNAVCPNPGLISLNITGGVSPYTVEWLDINNAVIATGNPFTSTTGGQFRVKITAANGCVYGTAQNGDTTYMQYISPVNFNVSTTAASCTNGTATSSAPSGAAPFSYLWNNAATTPSIAGLTQGSYTLTITDANGCTAERYGYVQQGYYINVNTTPTPATCLQTNGAAIAFASGGVPPYSYSWSNAQNSQSITGLTGLQYYDVTVTDAAGCTGSGSAYVSASTPITVAVSATASQCTSATGTATLTPTGGTPPYSYSWGTFPAQTGSTATGLVAGQYHFTVTDAAGCIRTGMANIPPVSQLNATVSGTNTPCNASTGTASIAVTGGTSPYTYNWSNGGTTAGISGLAAGSYTVTVTDGVGCSISKYRYVASNTPVNLGFASSQASCIYNNDGTTAVVATGGTAPYTYSWSNGGNTAAISGLLQGHYNVSVTDAAGCHASGGVTVGYNAANNSCYCTITGKVYNDANANCVMDAGEAGIPNIMVHASGFGYTYTNAFGIYSFRVPSGTYTMSESIQAYYPLAACQSNAVPVTVTAAVNCTTTVNFANTTATIHDVSIQTTNSYGPPVPGNAYNQLVVISNNGTVPESSVKSGYHTDGQLNSPVFTPAHYTLNGANQYNSTPAFPSLTPGATQAYNVHYTVPTNIPLATTVLTNDTAAYSAPMSNWLLDYSPWNNVNAYTTAVVGSFDPNYKEVAPRGTGAQGFIKKSDSTLTYTIHFQNTGTWPAQKVVLVDTLDGDLNIASLKPGYSSHNYSTTVTEGGVVTFTFNNINLPDSASEPLRSQGLVMYTIRLKPNLAVGTQLKNNADIYFDYNSPVRTNTTLNTIETPGGQSVSNTVSGTYGLQVFPNPASSQVAIRVEAASGTGRATLTFRNLLGQPVLRQEVMLVGGSNVFSADVAALANGVYFVDVKSAGHQAVTKLNIVR